MDAVMHYDICMQAIVTCEHCHEKLKRADLFEHRAKNCQEFPVQCPNCQMLLKRKEMHAHREDCLEVEVKCPEGCG